MSKKNGRPESKNAEYFPHHTEISNELLFLERKYDSEGYRAYWRLLEMVTKADDHHIKLQTENQTLTFRYGMNVPVEILDECINYLLEVEFIDRHMWEKENIIWIPWLIEKLKPVYANRGKSPPQKVGKRIVSSSRKSQYRKGKAKGKDKDKETTVKGSKSVFTPIDDLDIKNVKEDYKGTDVDKSLKRYLKYYGDKNPSVEGFKDWLDNDEAKGLNIKQPSYKQFDSGNIRAYCSKCGESDTLGSIQGTRELTRCCGAEYQPEPHATIEQG